MLFDALPSLTHPLTFTVCIPSDGRPRAIKLEAKKSNPFACSPHLLTFDLSPVLCGKCLIKHRFEIKNTDNKLWSQFFTIEILPEDCLRDSIHNHGELGQSSSRLFQRGGKYHVESIFLGFYEPGAARTDRCRPGPGSRSGPIVQNFRELSRAEP